MKAVDYALAYAARGWRVFPAHGVRDIKGTLYCTCSDPNCSQPGKHPVAKLVPHGCKDATTDPDTIRGWWKGFPKANVGIATGRDSALVVVDVDCGEGKSGDETLSVLEDRHGALPDTAMVLTGGGGRHYLFTYPDGVEKVKSTNSRIGLHIDSRADGGYMIAPPSRHISGNTYEWEASSNPLDGIALAPLPGWILESLQAKADLPGADPLADGETRLTAPEVREMRAALAYIDPDNRDVWLQTGMALHSTGAGKQAFGLWCEWSQGSEKYDAADQRRVWASFKGGGVTKAAIFGMAQQAGWLNTAAKEARPAADGSVVVQLADRRGKPGADWKAALVANARGGLYADLANVALILQHDPAWSGVLAFDEFAIQVIKRRKPPYDPGTTGEWSDLDDSKTAIWLTQRYALRPKLQTITDAVKVVAELNAYHPVREYLTGLAWDARPRVTKWLIHYLGCTDTPYIRLVGRAWMVAAVARIMEPGCKADNVLILEGGQGLGKSTALSILASPWFTDTPFDLGNREAFMAIRGKWVVELAELDSFNRAESSRAKGFFAAASDTYRPPWGRHAIDVRRQCVFAGTVNQDEYFRDETGNRRYWPVRVARMAGQALRADRDQLWAEAVSMYRHGEQWWVDSQLEDVQAEQETRFMADPWEDRLRQWVTQRYQATRYSTEPFFVTVSGALEYLEIPPGKWTRADQMRVSGVFKRLGLIRKRMNEVDGKPWGYAWRTSSDDIPT